MSWANNNQAHKNQYRILLLLQKSQYICIKHTTARELRISHEGNMVILSGWVHRIRALGAMLFLDIRDRFGKTQLVFDETLDPDLLLKASNLGREFVIRVEGLVRERSSKNDKMATGAVR